MKEGLRNLAQISLEWFLYIDSPPDQQVLSHVPSKLWSLFKQKKDLFFADLNLQSEHLAHKITMNGHLHLLREVHFDVNRLNKRGESCLQIAMQTR